MFPPCRWKWSSSDNSQRLLLGDCDPWEVKDNRQYQSTLVLAFIVTIFGIEVGAKHLYRRKSFSCFPLTAINKSSDSWKSQIVTSMSPSGFDHHLWFGRSKHKDPPESRTDPPWPSAALPQDSIGICSRGFCCSAQTPLPPHGRQTIC